MRKYSKNILMIGGIAFLLGISSVAWAAFSSVDLKDFPAGSKIEINAFGNPVIRADLPRSRAPEPSTLALFGSGLLGMIIHFIRRTYYIAKRILDIVISVVALVILSPLIVAVIVFIKCVSSGPVIFTQQRVGKSGRLFNIFKFRTMHVNAENTTGPVWASLNDPRLIPFGNILRKSHVDEVPQFINVLRGEMSVIGPRPERPEFVDQFKKDIVDYEKRLSVKPGITGLAQVWHKYDETAKDVRKKIKYDLLYIKKVCFWTDILILLRTFRVVVTGEGAR